ncbi:UNVERIFIED_CONTAM: hypothetical protein Sindi_0109800 [Sesamum indicum]
MQQRNKNYLEKPYSLPIYRPCCREFRARVLRDGFVEKMRGERWKPYKSVFSLPTLRPCCREFGVGVLRHGFGEEMEMGLKEEMREEKEWKTKKERGRKREKEISF